MESSILSCSSPSFYSNSRAKLCPHRPIIRTICTSRLTLPSRLLPALPSITLPSRLLPTLPSISKLCPSGMSPWLILPPLLKGGDMEYMLYDLAGKHVKTEKKRRDGVDLDQVPPDGARFVGSSHGWLASFDEDSSHVFLSNPISGRHIKLPPINTLRDPYAKAFSCFPSTKLHTLSRVILSSSPDEPECQAMTAFGPGGRLAFCSPRFSTQWTPLGVEHFDRDAYFHEQRPHEDFVYCTRRKSFASITPCKFELEHFYFDEDVEFDIFEDVGEPCAQLLYWDILKSHFEFPHPRANCFEVEKPFIRVIDEVSDVWGEGEHLEMLRRQCVQIPHLVCAEQLSDHPLVVLRFLNREMGYKTVCFLVLKHLEYFTLDVVKELNGLAIFVGMNHSFAIPATGTLKPNSIYFTDAGRITPPDGRDCGIFDYDKKKIVSPYCNFITHPHPPMWFTPNSN